MEVGMRAELYFSYALLR